MTSVKIERAKRAITKTPQFTDEGAVATLRGLFPRCKGSWGSAPLHPRLYAVAALRGLITLLQLVIVIHEIEAGIATIAPRQFELATFALSVAVAVLSNTGSLCLYTASGF
jgi:hypothetical protein